MTFKHVKFEDSPTMRALEKVAQEKGLVKPETLEKKASASKQLDLAPSSDLMENILKLCSGLRSKGLTKEASEIETNYLNYKQAQTLYETSKEKGEDLIDAAHPDGSHKLENVEGDEAVVETIVDQYLKSLEVVKKNPQGKLSEAKSIISAVKTIFAQDTRESLQQNIRQNMSLVNKNLARIDAKTKSELTVSVGYSYIPTVSELTADPTIDNLEKLKETLEKLRTRLDPTSWVHYATFGASGLSKDTWAGVQSLLDSSDTAVTYAMASRKALKELENQTEVSPQQQTDSGVSSPTQTLQEYNPSGALTPLYQRIGKVRQGLHTYSLFGNIANNQQAMKWINDTMAKLKGLTDRMGRANDSEEAELAPEVSQEITDIEADVKQFHDQWIQPTS